MKLNEQTCGPITQPSKVNILTSSVLTHVRGYDFSRVQLQVALGYPHDNH